ncbi:MAG: serine/threonine protein kinase [Mucilaginibacter sp.]|nr:serine/threonine protein kinase [Mucilaginibacter sp.]
MSKVFTIMEGLENMGAIRTGGQGSVYKGRRIGPILSAVKLLPTPIADETIEDKNYRTFVNEVEKLKKVNEVANPNVVKILSSGITESGSLPFIEMEFIDGPDLGELLSEPHEKIFTIKETIKLADQLAGALAHCHKVGVKHGDIKSNNVKFNVHTGNYVLLDFGLSIMSDEERRSSMRHAGAIEFMAPEQNEGQMLFQTDIYSYGVVLYELLAATVPFPLHDNGETARNTVMIAHMEAPVPDLLALRKQNLPANWTSAQKEHEMQVPAWLLNIIYKCLEKLPDNRYGNGIDLQEAIVQNSVLAGNIDNNSIVLKTENEILQTQVLQLQEAAAIAQKTTITVSKFVFNSAIGFIILLLCLSTYGLLHKKVSYQSSPQTAVNYVPFLLRYKPIPTPAVVAYKKDSVSNTHKLRAKAAFASKRKPHRKKFLGLF